MGHSFVHSFSQSVVKKLSAPYMARTCTDEQCTVLTLRSSLPSGEMSKKMVNKIVYVTTLTKSISPSPKIPKDYGSKEEQCLGWPGSSSKMK